MERLEIPVGEFVFDALAAGPGDGALVLLLHGFPETAIQWEHQLDALGAAGYRAVAPDQRGYSPRARPAGVEPYAVDHLAADVLAIADWLGAHTCHLAGHDWGGAVAWVLAARYPERLRTLTVVSTPHPGALTAARDHDADQKDRSSYMRLFRSQPGAAEDELLANGAARLRELYTGGMPSEQIDEYVRRFSERPALTAALNWYRAMRRDTFVAVGTISTPTLYVWGDEDWAIGRAAAEATREHVTGPFRFEVLNGTGHWVTEQRPEPLTELLLSHIAGPDEGTFVAK